MAYTENGRIGSMKLSDTSVVYYQGQNLQEVKSVIETGMTMAFTIRRTEPMTMPS